MEEKLSRYIGHRVRELREKGGLSQEDLGTQIGLSRSQISAIERGRSIVNVDQVQMIAEALGRPLFSLFPPQSSDPDLDLLTSEIASLDSEERVSVWIAIHILDERRQRKKDGR